MKINKLLMGLLLLIGFVFVGCEDDAVDESVTTIKIRTGANGSGTELTSIDVGSGQSITVFAAGYDGSGDYVEDISVTWTIASNLGTVSESKGDSTWTRDSREWRSHQEIYQTCV